METVTRLRAPLTDDAYGAPRRNWASAASTTLAARAVAPRTYSEPVTDARASVVLGVTVYLPAGTDVEPSDRLVVRGVTYEVDGEPGDWRSPFSAWTPGIEVQCRRVDG